MAMAMLYANALSWAYTPPVACMLGAEVMNGILGHAKTYKPWMGVVAGVTFGLCVIILFLL